MPAAFRLRPTEARDLPAIAEIYGNSVRTATASYELEPPGLEEMTRRWQAVASRGFPHFVAVADGGDDVLGYAYAGPYHTRPGYRFTVEDSIYIAPPAQRKGIGEALLCPADRHLRSDGLAADDRHHRRHRACRLDQAAREARIPPDRQDRGVRLQARQMARHGADAAGPRARQHDSSRRSARHGRGRVSAGRSRAARPPDRGPASGSVRSERRCDKRPACGPRAGTFSTRYIGISLVRLKMEKTARSCSWSIA